jgi:hypothetical protein
VNGTASILSSELRAMVVRLQSTSVSRLWWAEARRLKGLLLTATELGCGKRRLVTTTQWRCRGGLNPGHSRA